MNINSHLLNLASDLGDNEEGNEFARWSKEDLLRYWNEAVCIIADLRKDLFSCPVLIPLKAGAVQDISPCSKLGRVIGQADQHGNLIKTVAEASTDLSERWVGKSCVTKAAPSADYAMQSYTTDVHTSKTVVVDPPVPANKEGKVFLQVFCTREPKQACLGDEFDELDCGHKAAAMQWVMARAYSGSVPGSTDANMATMHAQMFFQLLNVKMRADLMYSLGVVPSNAKNLIDTRA